VSEAYTTYVQPLLQYASSVWSPHSVGLIKNIESVQQRFTKRIQRCDKLNYCGPLAKVSIDSLELRRLRFDLINTYKILFGPMDTSPDNFLVSAQAVLHVGIAGSHLYINPARMQLFFSRMVVQCWNDLPACDKTLLVLPPLSNCLIKLTLDITHSTVHDNVWFRI